MAQRLACRIRFKPSCQLHASGIDESLNKQIVEKCTLSKPFPTQPLPARLCLAARAPLLSAEAVAGLCPAFLNDSRSLTCETRCHKIPSERLYNALKRCVSLQRRTGANYSLLETREIHLQHRTSDHKAPRAYFCCI